MTTGPTEEALFTAHTEAKEWDDGSRALILTGSHARGDAHPESDLDLRIVGEGPSSKLRKRREPFLISISAMSEEENRKAFSDPSECAELIPGWRTALILIDPKGTAQKLKDEAEAWSWDQVDAGEVDDWVAEQLTAMSEEIHTLVGNLDQDIRPAAAATVSGIATELPSVMAVRRRVLYSSEKELWDRVADEMGGDWGDLQSQALGEASLEDAAEAAFRLFVIAAADAEKTFDDRQREVVHHACKLAKERIEAAS